MDIADYPAPLRPWAAATEELYTSHVTAKPIDVDWSNAFAEARPELYDSLYEADHCPECNAVILDGNEHEARILPEDASSYVQVDGADLWLPPEDAEDWIDEHLDGCAGTVELCTYDSCPPTEWDGSEGPMMNWAYPIVLVGRMDQVDAARAIVDLPLCLVDHPDHGLVLALTGGGMDLSWDICRAYVALGQLPPMHFTPPRFGGLRLDESTGPALAAFWRSATIAETWARQTAEGAALYAADLARGES